MWEAINMGELKDEELLKATKEDRSNYKPKKYNVHGKITVGDKPNTVKISYYECDDIKCNKIIIK